ncbi:Indoleamine 2,3-dioxygenase [Piedraia hortae CBS 480.64]|uniref:Indoleamine 2,3-dioxygenase n=1 Tax=Piedraia hortae CBS 480.64 TaxID=1314780 RepID=A0A6A7C8U2_9PEZI|nr:Indoleamine 2,3-dioxygenase [Piedraia hortae CBS 480.64]
MAIPKLEDYDISAKNGFLPAEPPLEALPDAYYQPWEDVMKNLHGLILGKRLHKEVNGLPVLSTDRLVGEPQWRRAHSILGFIVHAYIWGGERAMEWVPPPIAIPFQETSKHLGLPPVAAYAGLVLWNWRPIFKDEETVDFIDNLDMIHTFTGSLDERWFYIISVAIEARGAQLIPLTLKAMEAVEQNDPDTVAACLRSFAEGLDELGTILHRMNESCDPHVFYHRIRPYLAGGKNMAQAGLPNGVVFDNGGPMNKQRHVQYSGGSNAQSSILQYFDIVLGVTHRPTGTKPSTETTTQNDTSTQTTSEKSNNFIHDMRTYMPRQHARFLTDMENSANIRPYVQTHPTNRALSVAFDTSVAMLSAFRSKHLQIASRYIVIPSQIHNKQPNPRPIGPARPLTPRSEIISQDVASLRGTGGTSLMSFLRQARDETNESAVEDWTREVLSKKGRKPKKEVDKVEVEKVQGLANVWQMDTGGGLCHF